MGWYLFQVISGDNFNVSIFHGSLGVLKIMAPSTHKYCFLQATIRLKRGYQVEVFTGFHLITKP